VSDESMMPLRDAVERFKQVAGYSNAYDWYRKQAHERGCVWMGDELQLAAERDTRIRAVKIGRTWMVYADELEARLAGHALARAELKQLTADYDNHVLHGGPGATLRTSFGSYTVVSGDFHAARYDSYKPHESGDVHYRCSGCWELASQERDNPECHRCRDWSPCGRDCTLSRVYCASCGTSLDR